MCAFSGNKGPKSIVLYQTRTEHWGEPNDGVCKNKGYPIDDEPKHMETDNHTEAFELTGKNRDWRYDNIANCEMIHPFLVLNDAQSLCTLSGVHDSTLNETVALVFDPLPLEATFIRDIFVVMDLGVYDYSKCKNGICGGTHQTPAFAIGGNVSCSHRGKESLSQDVLISLRIGQRVINQDVTNKINHFYMQVYDERYVNAMYDPSYRMNLRIEHKCIPEDDGTKTLILPLTMEKIKGRKRFYPNYRTVLRAADFAVCPTFWFDNLELGSPPY
ncbi:hypothetical protein DdX_13150 [Ditylenchus destructor]|uniref:Uncharacterized protein n=1 Tax=Ditylenchus destructor TaxID=166010 RepID=A0AAD4MWX5_9BILA|nr:hypothetical protein DdX_13150 [Ditylenchus destructor]